MKLKLYLKLFMLLVSITSNAQQFTENFDTNTGIGTTSFTKTLSGVTFTFTATGAQATWFGSGGFNNSSSLDVAATNNNTSTTETFVIKRQDSNDFVFTSLFFYNFYQPTTVAGYNNNVLVGSAQTPASGPSGSGVLNFSGIVVDEVRISSTNLGFILDAFVGNTLVQPEINVQGNTTTIADGDATPSLTDHTDFGIQSVCTGTIIKTYTIQNTGTVNLNISGVTITGSNAADFNVITAPAATVAAAASTTFQVAFNPSSTGTKSATINIANNDADESTYNFAIQGTTGVDPEINVQGDTTTIVDGGITPSLTDHTDFGNQSICSGTIVRTFTIQNTGTSNLILNNPTLSGTNANDFSITANPSTSVLPSGSTTFQITFNPSATGIRTATVAFTNNDCDESTYDFAISGNGTGLTLPEGNVTNVHCFGGTSGTASVNLATGGTAPYNYDWTPGNPVGDGTTSITGLTAGTWTCTVTDATSCTTTRSYIITQPTTALTASTSQNNILCNGGSNGSATVVASGGTAPYTYSWTGGGTSATKSGVFAGNYTCTITDFNACQITRFFNITQPTALYLEAFSQTNVTCNGGATGAARVNLPTGGAGGYTYNWTPGNPTGDGTTSVTGLTAGTWTCTVTDANSCTKTQSFTVTQPASVVAPTAASPQNYTPTSTVANLTTTSGTNIQWYATLTGGTALAPTTQLTNNTTYYVSQKVNTCESVRTAVLVNNVLSVNENNLISKLKIYPNPTFGKFNIEIQENATVTLTDLLSKVIVANPVKSGNSTIDISNYQAGMYLLNIANENGSVTKKIIKE